MRVATGFITLHRQITKWEWYKDSCTKDLFLHLLLTASFVDTRFLGKKIKRGQVVTSLPSLASETGMSIQNVRTALKHLISTGEVTDSANRQYRIITVVKYDEYQNLTDDLTFNQQTANRQLTDSQQYNNNINNVNNNNNKKREKEKKQTKPFTPPTLQEVLDYVSERGNKIDGEYFFYYYEDKGWDMKNWKAKIITWEKREEKYKNGSGNGRGSGSPEGNHGQNKPDYSKFSAGIIQL